MTTTAIDDDDELAVEIICSIPHTDKQRDEGTKVSAFGYIIPGLLIVGTVIGCAIQGLIG